MPRRKTTLTKARIERIAFRLTCSLVLLGLVSVCFSAVLSGACLSAAFIITRFGHGK